MSSRVIGQSRPAITASHLRTDPWWALPITVVIVLGSFIVYSTWAAFQNAHYFVDPYLSVSYANLAGGESQIPDGPWGTGGTIEQRLGAWIIAPGITSEHDLDDVLAPGRRIAKAGPISGGAAGSAPMGGRTNQKDAWGDGMINEEERGSAHDM